MARYYIFTNYLFSFQHYVANFIIFLKKIVRKIYYFIRHDHERIGFQNPVER